jgi:hypothetical protein
VNLETDSKPAARAKVKRLLAQNAAGAAAAEVKEQAKRAESFADTCKRCNEGRLADGVKTAKDELARLNAYAIPTLGELEITAITTGHVNETLDAAKAAGLARGTVVHLKQDMANVLARAKREGVIKVNPCVDAELPKFKKTVKKVRAVLADDELPGTSPGAPD